MPAVPRTRWRAALTTVLASLLSSAAAAAQPAPSQPDDTWKSPAKAADPPIWPTDPNGSPPTSISGTAIESSSAATAPAVVVSDKAAESAQEARIEGLEARVARDEQQIRALEHRMQLLKNLRFEGYIQPQFIVQSFNAAASPNLRADGRLPPGVGANDTIARPDGTTTNTTLFRVRRTRLRTFYETDVTRFFVELDAMPEGGVGPGIGTILRGAEATGIARWTRDVRTEIGAGLFLTPFRRELLEVPVHRPFIEPTWFSQNAFPTERDYGARAKTIAFDGRLTLDLAVVNGQRLGEKTFVALPDLNRSKDFIGYLTYEVGCVTLGVSGYVGYGQVVDAQALRFKQFTKWAMNYQASVERAVIHRLGESRLSAELTFAQNMDSGVVYSFAVPRIPTNISNGVANLDERAFYVRAEQDLGRRLTAGYRYDMYAPDTSIKNNARNTHAFVLVGRITPNLRWMNEIDWAIDNVHPSSAAPPSKHILTYSSVLQGMF
jgi:hypothetical protein